MLPSLFPGQTWILQTLLHTDKALDMDRRQGLIGWVLTGSQERPESPEKSQLSRVSISVSGFWSVYQDQL